MAGLILRIMYALGALLSLYFHTLKTISDLFTISLLAKTALRFMNSKTTASTSRKISRQAEINDSRQVTLKGYRENTGTGKIQVN